MWVEFVVGSRPCSEGIFPGTPVFLPPQKPTLLNSNSIWVQFREPQVCQSKTVKCYTRQTKRFYLFRVNTPKLTHFYGGNTPPGHPVFNIIMLTGCSEVFHGLDFQIMQ